jgi:aminotransferase in exopolysaccharide biosynthesis
MTSSRALESLIAFIREIYGQDPIPLHRPVFAGNERKYVVECIDSNFVSSIGARVTEFEQMVARYTGSKHAVATVNGTAALQVALRLVGVRGGDEVLTQAVTFVATCNALAHLAAEPVFVDVDRETMGMSPDALHAWLSQHAERRPSGVFNRTSGRRVAACVPMHTFGHPCRVSAIQELCAAWNLPLIEDAAESLGSRIDGRHTGTFGVMGTLSFNGNKVITTGGGGMILTDDERLAAHAKHLTTTAKRPHPYEFFHDEIGYNYRLPNLNAALGCAQMETLPAMLRAKAEIARRYSEVCGRLGIQYVAAPAGAQSWLHSIVLDDVKQRDWFLRESNSQGVMTRPIWRLMSALPAFEHCQHDGLKHSTWLEERVVNIPSGVPDSMIRSIAP